MNTYLYSSSLQLDNKARMLKHVGSHVEYYVITVVDSPCSDVATKRHPSVIHVVVGPILEKSLSK
jgi:hypothetical protein